MRYIHLITLAACMAWSLAVSAQQPPAGGRGRIGGAGIGAYPAREPGDPAAIARGRNLYSTNCAFCHGADTRGGASGPSLLRSAVVLDDKTGELIRPVVQAGRPDRGMPKFPLSNEQIADLAVFLHSFTVAGYDASRQRPATIVVGQAAAGEAVFKTKCASCHSTAGDLHRGRADTATVMAHAWQHGRARRRTDAGALPGPDRGRDAAVRTETRRRTRARR